MNKYQEALNFLDWHCQVSHQEQQDLLQGLIDKETPMKPIINEKGDYICPTCLTNDSIEDNIFCGGNGFHERCNVRSCGQLIDWKD